MNIFDKGNFVEIDKSFVLEGIEVLQHISAFQEKTKIHDTDTTINSIRDSIIAGYLDYDLINIEKHGFDARNSKLNTFLEIKQCSYGSKRWG